jgi:sugar phosphate isomerase/epimerase
MQTMSLHPRLGVSTWSLNKSLTAGTPLLDIPAQVAAHGLGKLEVCHFHFPSTIPGYLAEFRAALDAANVEFYTLLIDEGDLTHPDPVERARVITMMAHWIEVAAACGGKRVRVIAGDAVPSAEALAVSETGMNEVLRHADANGIHVVVENWHPLLDSPAEVVTLLEDLKGRIGLKMDFGNWSGERKFTDLPQIAPLAECTHAKAAFPAPGEMNREDFTRCLDICRDAGFGGPHILIFSDPGDEWESLDQMREVVRPYVGDAA